MWFIFLVIVLYFLIIELINSKEKLNYSGIVLCIYPLIMSGAFRIEKSSGLTLDLQQTIYGIYLFSCFVFIILYLLKNKINKSKLELMIFWFVFFISFLPATIYYFNWTGFFRYCQFLICLTLILVFLNDGLNKARILKLITISSLLIVIATIMGEMLIAQTSYHELQGGILLGGRPFSHTTLGVILITLITIGLKSDKPKSYKIKWILTFLLLLFLTKSRTNIGLFFILILFQSPISLLLVPIGSVFVFYSEYFDKIFQLYRRGQSIENILGGNGRIELWSSIFNEGNISFFGYGYYNGIVELIKSQIVTSWSSHQAHNDFINILYNGGLFSLSLILLRYCYIYLISLKNFSENKLAITLISILIINGFLHNVIGWDPGYGLVYLVLFSAMINSSKEYK